MKKLIEHKVIKINYQNFLKQYILNGGENDANDDDLYEHFLINPFIYSKPYGFLPLNYEYIKEGILEGIHIFEVIDYVNITVKMYKCKYTIEEENENKDDDDDDDIEDVDSEEDIIEKKKKSNNKITKKEKTGKKNIKDEKKYKKKESLENKNKNYNQFNRLYRFLLYDGQKFIYAYEDEFNENFNYLENGNYKRIKILVYNNPLIKSGVLIIKKNQALILYKGHIASIQKEEVKNDKNVIDLTKNDEEIETLNIWKKNNIENKEKNNNITQGLSNKNKIKGIKINDTNKIIKYLNYNEIHNKNNYNKTNTYDIYNSYNKRNTYNINNSYNRSNTYNINNSNNENINNNKNDEIDKNILYPISSYYELSNNKNSDNNMINENFANYNQNNNLNTNEKNNSLNNSLENTNKKVDVIDLIDDKDDFFN